MIYSQEGGGDVKRVKFALLMLTASLLFTSCEKKITHGEIYAKKFTPAHTQIVMMPYTIANGTAVSTVCIPYYLHYEDDWAVSIKAIEGGKERTATYRVSEALYNACEIGGEFTYDAELCQEEPTYSKVPEN